VLKRCAAHDRLAPLCHTAFRKNPHALARLAEFYRRAYRGERVAKSINRKGPAQAKRGGGPAVSIELAARHPPNLTLNHARDNNRFEMAEMRAGQQEPAFSVGSVCVKHNFAHGLPPDEPCACFASPVESGSHSDGHSNTLHAPGYALRRNFAYPLSLMAVPFDTSPQVNTLGKTPQRVKTPEQKLPQPTSRVLSLFFWLAARVPTLMRGLRPIVIRVVPFCSASTRANTASNALRIFGKELNPTQQRTFTRNVVNSFYEFVTDVGRSSDENVERLLQRIERVDGEAAYRDVRKPGRGAVLVTAHMGSFEVGLAALKRVERRVHVVYKRDASPTFEAMRMRMRQMLGVLEAPIDEGLSTWMDLRDALLEGDVVVMQADRAMAGQRSAVVPFLHGSLRIPTGAVRLARLTGSPIVPVFTVRLDSGRFAVYLFPAIEPGTATVNPESSDPSVVAIARSIESMVARYPTQWLMLGNAFEEKAPNV